MASSKANRFDPQLYKLSLWFKDLAPPAHIIIVLYLLEHGTTSYATLCKQIILDKKTVSQHLRFLRRENIVFMDEKYPYSYYTLNTNAAISYLAKSRDLSNKFIRLLRGTSGQTLPLIGK